MASYALHTFRCSRKVVVPRCRSSIRQFSASTSALAKRPKVEEKITADDAFDILDDDFDDDDTATAGHFMLQEQRQVLYYLRLIEHEMPKLVAYRKRFTAPSTETPLIIKTLDYAGEEHPVLGKRVIVAPVNELPLKDAAAIHKFKLLAGPRWTPNPPADSGVSTSQPWGDGFIKISCEDFPKPAQNLKWSSDVLDRLIAEANDPSEKFEDIPVDLRHVYARTRKAKRGDHLRGRQFSRPSIRDFPKEWLDSTPTPPVLVSN